MSLKHEPPFLSHQSQGGGGGSSSSNSESQNQYQNQNQNRSDDSTGASTTSRPRATTSSSMGTGELPGILRDREREQAHESIERDMNLGNVVVPRRLNTDIPRVLPHEKVFPIQIGNQLFRLSGASISSDAPSYFSQFFVCQLKENGDDANSLRTLYIDRDPATFSDISLHLQGYHVAPRNSSHFVKLFADAQFYSLPRLMSQLYEESIFISIGHRDFQIPRELFSDPGNSPNYFSLGFAVFFSTPTEVFPGLDREGLLRPPSIMPPSVPNRSADTFTELLHLLRGYPVKIKSEEHRAELVKDCRYFHFKGLEQKIIRCEISFNLARRRKEIVLRLEDVRQSGISVVPERATTPPAESAVPPPLIAFVNYARPYVDTTPYELVLEIGDECTKLHFPPQSKYNGHVRAEFFGDGRSRISRLFEVIATKLNLPTSQPLGLLMKSGGASSQPPSPGNTSISEDWVRVELGADCFATLDGKEWRGRQAQRRKENHRSGEWGNESTASSFDEGPSRKRRRTDGGDNEDEIEAEAEEREETWIVKTGQWRLRVQQSAFMNPRTGKGGPECVLVGVKIEAVREEWGRNRARGFLGH